MAYAFDTVAVGSDHGGLMLKEAVAAYCRQKGLTVVDCGTETPESVDYPVYAEKVCRFVQAHPGSAGILCCGTGIGMSIAANKFAGIRASVLSDPYSAEMTRRHNDANVLCLGGRILSPEKALELADLFLGTAFEGGRHQRRVDMISAIEKANGMAGSAPEDEGPEGPETA
ncbi:MAG: ribose 5-phosphate isomerase B [Clostridia bacterium]|nr:ribose 5-phosphate isomerase B [Clostridia bacterium]